MADREVGPATVHTVALSFQPAAEHVRTARLVAVAVARRTGLDEIRLDEIRLATGEVCARAVRRCAVTRVSEMVLVEIDDAGPVFEISVTDHSAGPDGEREAIALALVRGLADTVTVADGPGGQGGVVRMGWSR
jgi:anti-sigma regulatory factor (Ser/Thr protein kinase)